MASLLNAVPGAAENAATARPGFINAGTSLFGPRDRFLDNPVGTERLDQPELTNPTPGIDPVVGRFPGTRIPMTASQRSDLRQRQELAIGTVLGMAGGGLGVESKAGRDLASVLADRSAQQSWESMPGKTTGHLPELHDAPFEIKQAFHDDHVNLLTDERGRDIISQRLGIPTGETFNAPGVFEGVVSPGSQSRVAVGEIDPDMRARLTMAEAARGALLGQDAAAWHKPYFSKALPVENSNLVDIDLGRPLTYDEAVRAAQLAQEHLGPEFAPIATPTGFRLLNGEWTGMPNETFIAKSDAMLQALPSDAAKGSLHPGRYDGDYIPNDWSTQPNGEGYFERAAAAGRPDLQRAATQFLADYGPRVAALQDRYAQQYGWTPNPSIRLWEQPGFREMDGRMEAAGLPAGPRLSPDTGPPNPRLPDPSGSGAPPTGPP